MLKLKEFYTKYKTYIMVGVGALVVWMVYKYTKK
jgi:hypothetical protein